MHRRLLTLPPELELFPGHFAGSACGAGMSGKPSSTIAAVKHWNVQLSQSREDFIEDLIDVPEKPAEMAGIMAVNQGRSGAA